MAEEKLKLDEELAVKTKWARPEYQEYYDDLMGIIRARINLIMASMDAKGGIDNAAARKESSLEIARFYKELPSMVIGYFHRKRAFLSDAKDTHRLDWIIGKIVKGEASLDLRMARVSDAGFETFREAIDDCMLQEKDS